MSDEAPAFDGEFSSEARSAVDAYTKLAMQEPDRALEAINALPANLTIYFDGACEPRNPGGTASYGWVIKDDNGDIASGYGVAGENSTNNFAEYCALGFALRWLHDKGWKGTLKIYGDSRLVICQMTKEWKCNKRHLQQLRQRCWDLLEGITYTTHWIPREENEQCDALSRKAYEEKTGKTFPERKR